MRVFTYLDILIKKNDRKRGSYVLGHLSKEALSISLYSINEVAGGGEPFGRYRYFYFFGCSRFSFNNC